MAKKRLNKTENMNNVENILEDEKNKVLPLINFEYSDMKVRTIYKDGEIWFVANDIGAILELTDIRKSVALLDDDDRNTVPVMDRLGRMQNSLIINESSLYQLIFQSRKEEAKNFKKWVTKEVLPSIRNTGKYNVNADKELSYDEKRIIA